MERIGTIRGACILVLIALTIASCSLKTKTELYMERGLDLLSNKQQVDFALSRDVFIEELGVIRDKKEGKKILVFRMHPSTEQQALEGHKLSLRARIKQKDDSIRIEEWDFVPVLIEVSDHKYLTREIQMEEDRIQKLYIRLNDTEDGNKEKRGPLLTVVNLWTYND
jgi:hypothetical protein